MLVVLSMASAVAVARMGPGAGSPETTSYSGSDPAGKVTFTAHDLYAGSGPVYVFAFKFTTKCSAKATTVAGRMLTDKSYRFHYKAHAITIAGQLHKSLVKSGSAYFVHFQKADGSVRLHTARCDSGTMKFTAREGKTS